MLTGKEVLVASGIPELDEVLGGGIPAGGVILLAGHPGSGKSTFGAQFLRSGCASKEPGLYVSFSERKGEFFEHMRRLGLDLESFERAGLLKFLWFPTPLKTGLDLLLKEILRAIEEARAKRLVLDSITALLGAYEEREARTFLHNLINMGLKPYGVTTLLIAELPYGREIIGFGFEEFLVDAIFVLKTEEVRGLARRTLEIRKVRWAEVPRISYEFIISRGGISLYLPHVRGLEGTFSRERISTGIRELDEMLGGGVFRGAAILVTGPSGTGKTLLALTFAVEGARRGENVIYVSFEEPVDQLKTILSYAGLRPGVNPERLKFFSLTPRLFTPGSVLHFFRDLLEEYKPSRFVVDGLTALKRHYGDEFLDFIKSFSHMCKYYGTTLMMVSSEDVLRGERIEVDTVSDVLIALWFELREDILTRRIAVLKARGSHHDFRVRELRFVEGRVIIE